MSILEAYIEAFGEAEAVRIMAAAEEHQNGVHDNRGSDPFRWAIAIAIGFECATVPDYAKYHGIKVDPDAWKAWVREHADLAHHDGDVDYLALFAGAYQEFLPGFDEKVEAAL